MKVIMQGKRKNIMDEYVKLLILAYFKEFNGRYNLEKLKEKIGISFNMLDNFIGELVENSELSYKNNMLSITQKGRLKLINSEMEDYSYSINLENEYSNSRWSIEKIYTVHEFSKKKWRGSEM
ncbi:hypothetical protein LK537_05495 [Lachnoclostridium pacaense]|uniref:hypothetical protein n=1 Tax=Enterocloster hominis (ex Hitch et al. 2024) TaxID=1917870 RepID=UPI0012432402|nr:hypothetical protein [Lachnoclostridium pacaense]MCC2816744.1 hypothetical protein [Lachnoclostridium pacaense]